MKSSSVYLMANDGNGELAAAEGPSSWDQIIQKYPDMGSIIDNTVHLDADWNETYDKSSTSTIMFYGAVKYQPINSTAYSSIKRTYPGIAQGRNADGSLYDPTTRAWFSNAKEDGISIEAYKETFTGELVISLSSKKTTEVNVAVDSPIRKGTVTSVGTVVSRLGYLRELIKGITSDNRTHFVLIRS